MGSKSVLNGATPEPMLAWSPDHLYDTEWLPSKMAVASPDNGVATTVVSRLPYWFRVTEGQMSCGRVKTEADTNMPLSGQLAQPFQFRVQSIRIQMFGLERDTNLLLELASIRVSLANRVELVTPLSVAIGGHELQMMLRHGESFEVTGSLSRSVELMKAVTMRCLLKGERGSPVIG